MTDATRNGAARVTPQGSGTFAIDGVLTFDTVPELFDRADEWFRNGARSLTIDLKAVHRADSAGLALLVEWLRLAQSKGTELKLINVPEQMRSLIRVSGLSEALGVNGAP